MLRRHHGAPDTLVVDELGLRHGSGRADIAVVNGRLVGYEIKSNRDSLARLRKQIGLYDAIFDSITIVVGAKHDSVICRRVPRHWGVVLARIGKRGGINFHTKRRPRANRRVDLLSVAQLLWKVEALEMIREITSSTEILNLRRRQLYEYLSKNVPATKLRREVRSRLKSRLNWPGRKQSFQCDGSSRPNATLSDCQALRDAACTA
jgi:hypothetical protein